MAINKEELDWVELQKLAEKGISEDEIEFVVSEFNTENSKSDISKHLNISKDQCKREKTNQNFESGIGGFKRSQ